MTWSACASATARTPSIWAQTRPAVKPRCWWGASSAPADLPTQRRWPTAELLLADQLHIVNGLPTYGPATLAQGAAFLMDFADLPAAPASTSNNSFVSLVFKNIVGWTLMRPRCKCLPACWTATR